MRVRLVFPPVHEQRIILDHLSAETKAIEHAIGDAQREIELLREYRTRLITDVVTGKLDVCAVAAKLPDEPEELEPLDEIETSDESEEALNGPDLEEDTLEEHV